MFKKEKVVGNKAQKGQKGQVANNDDEPNGLVKEIMKQQELEREELNLIRKEKLKEIDLKFEEKIEKIKLKNFPLPINKRWNKKKQEQLKGQTYEDYLIRKKLLDEEQERYEDSKREELIKELEQKKAIDITKINAKFLKLFEMMDLEHEQQLLRATQLDFKEQTSTVKAIMISKIKDENEKLKEENIAKEHELYILDQEREDLLSELKENQGEMHVF